jgi:hypothetical protein
MASFLRQLSLRNRQSEDPLQTALNDEATELSLVDSMEELNVRQAEIREKYAQLLMQRASTSAQFQNAIMLTGYSHGNMRL